MDFCTHIQTIYLQIFAVQIWLHCLDDLVVKYVLEMYVLMAFSADTGGDDGDYGGRPGSGEAQSGVCVIL